MSIAQREHQNEADRKERVSAGRRDAKDKANKELHYQVLITENSKLKEVLELAKIDIDEWIDVYGQNTESDKILAKIKELI